MRVPGVHSKNIYIRHAVGGFLILLGVLGMILPIAPGIIFVVLGLEALGLRALLLARFEERMPERMRNHMRHYYRADHSPQKLLTGPSEPAESERTSDSSSSER